MHIHYFQHDHFEDLGYIGDWAADNHISTSVTRFDKKPIFPLHNEYDWLVVMGGKMGANDSTDLPWIAAEIEYIRQAINSGKIVIGICLGSQLIAKALGARVYKNTEPEMGFLPVVFNQNAHNDPVFRHFPSEITAMHMHFDIFELPDKAIPMAYSKITPYQAFRYGNNVFAFQFHFEITVSNAPIFIREVTPEIVPGNFSQSAEEMLNKIQCCRENNQIFSKVLNSILEIS